jgi:hypothetical protein
VLNFNVAQFIQSSVRCIRVIRCNHLIVCTHEGKNSYHHLNCVGFEVFTAVVMNSIIFWDMTPCSLLSCNRCFGGTYRLHLQGRRNNFSKNQQTNRWQGPTFTGVTVVPTSELRTPAILLLPTLWNYM